MIGGSRFGSTGSIGKCLIDILKKFPDQNPNPVIRVSGKNTSEVIKKITGSKLPIPRVATLRKFSKNGGKELIDEGVILWFPAPHSYTGEDMAEFHVHGSRAVIEAVYEEVSKIENCRPADAGEFTKLAFQNGKINLLKAESIADLISAETEIQRKQALKIMSGKSSNRFNGWREQLLKILSHVEAKIDFSDEDLPDNLLKDIKVKAEKIKFEIDDCNQFLGLLNSELILDWPMDP